MQRVGSMQSLVCPSRENLWIPDIPALNTELRGFTLTPAVGSKGLGGDKGVAVDYTC